MAITREEAREFFRNEAPKASEEAIEEAVEKHVTYEEQLDTDTQNLKDNFLHIWAAGLRDRSE